MEHQVKEVKINTTL